MEDRNGSEWVGIISTELLTEEHPTTPPAKAGQALKGGMRAGFYYK